MTEVDELVDKTNNLDEWVTDQFLTLNDSLTLFKMQISSLQKIVKNVEKDIRKEIKTLKKYKKNDVQKDKRAPSGFAKPTKVTKELCEFMNKPEGSEIARTEVTRTLVQYIKTHNLQEQTMESKNKIIPDDKLKNLLGIETVESGDLTFFNIQKYMNKHFISNKQKTIETNM
jgi:chromatin remodeling complex protein RSC6